MKNEDYKTNLRFFLFYYFIFSSITEYYSTLRYIIRHYATLFDIIRHYATLPRPFIFSHYNFVALNY